jgi:hypothetical protein
MLRGKLLGAILLIGAPCALASAQQELPLSITAKAIDAAAPSVEFSVVNKSAAPIQVYEAWLPWNGTGELVLVAKPDGQAPLRRVPVPGGFPRPDVRTLAPGEAISGVLRLGPEFEGLAQAIAHGRVIVFWHFDAQAASGDSLGQYGGWTALGSRATVSKRKVSKGPG